MSRVDSPARQSPQYALEADHRPVIPEKILEAIKGHGHRAVTMRPYPDPCSYRPEDLAEIVSECSVTYRGYAYPHLGNGRYGRALTTGRYAEACHDAFGHESIWRLYRSGQFKEYTGLSEDIVGDDSPDAFSQPSGGSRARYLEPIWTIYGMSEVFAFAANLATRTGKRYAVSVAFGGMEDRVLDIRTAGRIGFHDEYRSREGRIELDAAEVLPHLGAALYGRIALEKTLEALGYFGWGGDSPRDVLKYDQEQFYAKARQPF